MAGADAAALGRVQQALESAGDNPDPTSAFGQVERDVKQLFASGFTFNFERLNITLPSGTVAASMLFEFAEEDPATFDWSTLLLSTNASIDLSIPDPVVQMLVQTEPNMAMAIGGGYLVKRGDVYELEARAQERAVDCQRRADSDPAGSASLVMGWWQATRVPPRSRSVGCLSLQSASALGHRG